MKERYAIVSNEGDIKKICTDRKSVVLYLVERKKDLGFSYQDALETAMSEGYQTLVEYAMRCEEDGWYTFLNYNIRYGKIEREVYDEDVSSKKKRYAVNLESSFSGAPYSVDVIAANREEAAAKALEAVHDDAYIKDITEHDGELSPYVVAVTETRVKKYKVMATDESTAKTEALALYVEELKALDIQYITQYHAKVVDP